MPLSMHQASVPLFVRQLNALSAILTKAESFASEKGLAPNELIDARLAPDMHPLNRQVQIASDAAKGIARLAEAEVPSFPDDETSFDQLQARIAKTIAFLETLPADKFEGAETRTVLLKAGAREFSFTGEAFLLHFSLPNFYFHVTTAYAILRSKGVPLGKMDYLGGV